jgi:predicted transcriptional regulator YdeE
MATADAEAAGIRDMTFRIETRPRFYVVGIPQSSDAKGCFGEAWEQFKLLRSDVGNEVNAKVGYGLQVYPRKDTGKRFTYMACCEVADLQDVPLRFFAFTVPEADYAVFTVTNWNETLGRAWGAAYGKILPKSDYKPKGPWDFERYDERSMVAVATEQEMEIWIPVDRR